jgi:hypothetical protein
MFHATAALLFRVYAAIRMLMSFNYGESEENLSNSIKNARCIISRFRKRFKSRLLACCII